MEARWASTGSSRSRARPALPITTMPARHTTKPTKMIWPLAVQIRVESSWLENSGGISVPNVAVRPMMIAMPNERPR